MAQKVMELREHLDQSLRDETKPLGQIFGKLEAQTGVNRTYLFLGKCRAVNRHAMHCNARKLTT